VWGEKQNGVWSWDFGCKKSYERKHSRRQRDLLKEAMPVRETMLSEEKRKTRKEKEEAAINEGTFLKEGGHKGKRLRTQRARALQ